MTDTYKVLLLIDGLDEIEGDEETCEKLVGLLVSVARFPNVKLCVSSRPWNVFRDEFEHCPQLKLENITSNDISTYVRGQFHSNRRFLAALRFDPSTAETLVNTLIEKASGVFLWVRLVVKDLLKGLRDGDSIRTLLKKLGKIPADLDEYFLRLLSSIGPEHRMEASKLFQLALYDEDQFISLHSNRLLDFSFVEEDAANFALSPSFNFSDLDFKDRDAVIFVWSLHNEN